jgi:hypothetical protein
VRLFIKTAVVSCFIFALCSPVVHGDNGLTILILNDSNDALVVSVYDERTKPPQQIVASQTIYGNASVSISIAPDDSGFGHLKWTAVTQDRDMGTCGHGDRSKLRDGDTVTVHANGRCASHRTSRIVSRARRNA